MVVLPSQASEHDPRFGYKHSSHFLSDNVQSLSAGDEDEGCSTGHPQNISSRQRERQRQRLRVHKIIFMLIHKIALSQVQNALRCRGHDPMGGKEMGWGSGVTQPSDCQYDVTADDISAIGPSMTSYIADESGVWGRQGGREVSVYALSTSRNVKVLD